MSAPHLVLPPGGPLELPDRGTTFIRHLDGPADAPTVFLLHGWTATADLNWGSAYEALGRHFRVVAIDHRGHGRGIRPPGRFRLRDCADDVVAVCDALGIDRFVPVGYSMGGPIAQLTWKRHPDRVDGLVLCATSRSFSGSQGERMLFGAMPALAATIRLTPGTARRRFTERYVTGRFDDTPVGRWAADEVRRADSVKLIEAGASLGRFDSSPWIDRVDVPTAVVLTELDLAVPPERQRALANSIETARVHPVPGDHAVCVSDPGAFVPRLVEACLDVTRRTAVRF
ncbi:MAG TPA: alpha/beta hydrolase [Acidimicrobiales bacterium]|nr:alpha/beta hydrolase [Acidimicrobiales bacterium]